MGAIALEALDRLEDTGEVINSLTLCASLGALDRLQPRANLQGTALVEGHLAGVRRLGCRSTLVPDQHTCSPISSVQEPGRHGSVNLKVGAAPEAVPSAVGKAEVEGGGVVGLAC